MVAQSLTRETAPAIPRMSLVVNPRVHPSADVHEFSYVEGDVQLGAGSMVAPGTAIAAESGATIVVGECCGLLPGVLVEGLASAQVVSGAASSGASCSVWLGDRTIVAHKSIIHSPAFIGKDCFIGFRSTIFNARLGEGCVVMMHALVQDVEVPPGKCVPSGSVITSQHQADQLPNVRPEDLEFAKEVTGAAAYGSRPRNARGPSSRASSPSSIAPNRRSRSRLVPINSRSAHHSSSDTGSSGPASGLRASGQSLSNNTSYATEGANMQAQRLAPEIVQQVRQYLNQGYRIGMEHADARRYRSGVWETCTPIRDTREQVVFEALERCLAEHVGEYVRIFGIDTQVKRRVGMVTVQRPNGKPVSIDSRSVPSASNNGGGAYASSSAYGAGGYGAGSNGVNAGSNGGGLTPELVQEVRNLLRSGFIIGTEHADARRYRSNVWKSCSPIKTSNESEVLARLEHCLAEHSGEYVRMFGIDTQAKRRMASITIQRADGKQVSVSSGRPAAGASSAGGHQGAPGGGYGQSGVGGGGSNAAAAQAVNQILAQGNTVGVEFADARRYRSGLWQTAPSVRSVGQLQGFLAQNVDKYVRVFGVNTSMKTRGAATTIQKPGQNVEGAAPLSGSGVGQTTRDNAPQYGVSANSGNNGSGAIDSDVMSQVTQLVNQGCRIAIEFADKRRFRSGIWQTGGAIDARRPADAISALAQHLSQHQGDYVRLVGVDPKAKRRVLEATIQRP